MLQSPPFITSDPSATFAGPAEEFSLPARVWNALVNFLAENAIIVSSSVRSGGEDHAWRVVCEWAPEVNGFVLRITPGFVNALEVAVAIPAAAAPEAALNRIPSNRTDSVLSFLTEYPVIPVAASQWREDFSPPAFLTAIYGEPRKEPESISTEFGLYTVQPSYDPAQRAYRALSLWVQAPRPALAIETDANGLAQAVIVGTGGPAELIISGMAYAPASEPSGLELLGGLRDSGYDTQLIATVWLVGPEGSGNWADTTPDERWEPFVAQECFYNLNHDFAAPESLYEPDPLGTLANGLIGSEAIQISLLEKNRKDSIATALSNARISGYYWSV